MGSDSRLRKLSFALGTLRPSIVLPHLVQIPLRFLDISSCRFERTKTSAEEEEIINLVQKTRTLQMYVKK